MNLLTIREAADQLGLAPKTVRKLIRSGQLRGVRLGPRISRGPGRIGCVRTAWENLKKARRDRCGDLSPKVSHRRDSL